MTCAKDYALDAPQWCPGCGNFDVLESVKDALCSLGLGPRDFIMLTGIGQASKLGFSVKCNLFNGLHGRSLPLAAGVNLANHKPRLISVSGDGDYYAEGGNHFVHAARRNLDIAVFAGDNMVYGLTKGQASPTSPPEFRTPGHADGIGGRPLNPALLALASGATFVARGFSGEKAELAGLMAKAIEHRGFALVDIMFPCVSFNRINTFGWFKSRVKPIGPEHDPSDLQAALRLAAGAADGIPTGVLYRTAAPVFSEVFPALKAGPIAERTPAYTPERVRPLLDKFR
ncbi:MAG: thiamine pyrophosphate-dependent enzyme [Elusimicrobia bacterium]|nr:thiamine pyrophosphate-dependent enzyme [Elusimicrobiota bacterium]MDA8242502.1 thiamine pyrophosphate-dependent enzyme [Elusimicrobiota bacterium]